MASNGTVQAKTWNPNGLAAVANLPWTLSIVPLVPGVFFHPPPGASHGGLAAASGLSWERADESAAPVTRGLRAEVPCPTRNMIGGRARSTNPRRGTVCAGETIWHSPV